MYSLGTGTTGSRFLGKLNLYWIMRFKKEERKLSSYIIVLKL